MKYYSEMLNKLYNYEKELMDAEAEVKKAEAEKIKAEKTKKEERAKRAKEVETALKTANEAQAKAVKLLKDFTNDYGYFHTSYTTNDVKNKESTFNGDEVNDFFDLLYTFLG